MACPEFENLILEYSEGAEVRDALEPHLAGCARCRAFLKLQQELDLRLSRSVNRPMLSAAFDTRLAARIAVQRESPRFRSLARVLDWTGYLSLAFAGGCLLQQLPHAGTWIGLAALAGSAAFALWETCKALRGNYGHR